MARKKMLQNVKRDFFKYTLFYIYATFLNKERQAEISKKLSKNEAIPWT